MNPLKVDRADGSCRSCGGTLQIVDADDATLTVECLEPECCDVYEVETDAFGDGCMIYWVEMMSRRHEEGDAE